MSTKIHPTSTAEVRLVGVLNAIVEEVTALRADIIALAAKLDDDAGVTDTNYEAGLTDAVELSEVRK